MNNRFRVFLKDRYFTEKKVLVVLGNFWSHFIYYKPQTISVISVMNTAISGWLNLKFCIKYIVPYLWKSYNHLIILKSKTLFAHDTLMNKPNTQFAHGYINEGSKYSIWSFNIYIYKMMIKANTPFVHLHW